MSKFINEDNKKSREQVGYDRDTDVLRGFKRAVTNNQQMLALEYLVQILDILEANFEVKDESVPADVAPKSQTTKATKATNNQEANATD